MTPELLVTNLAAWWLQVALLVGAATLMVWLLRIRSPRFLLSLWHTLLIACLLLPAMQSWQRPEVPAALIRVPAIEHDAPPVPMVIGTPMEAAVVPWQQWVVVALAGGIALRFAWLGLGLLRLKRYRRRAELLDPIPDWLNTLQLQMRVWPAIAVSSELRGAVTYGFRDPWVLLPRCFADMPREQQLSVLCHELNHVSRRDWLFKIVEELFVSVLWFHPAIWWLNARIQLAREQVVDQLTVEVTGERQDYLDALLAVATHSQEADLVPATLFLKRRHLRRRVMEILKESRMSKRHVLSMLVVLGGTLAGTARYATLTFPLTAPATMEGQVADSRILHRTAVQYPVEARQKGIEGTVVVEVTLDQGGHVIGQNAISGPDELRQAALKSVIDWHFATPPAPGKTQVSVDFTLPPQAPVPERVSTHITVTGTPGTARTPGSGGAPPPPPPPPQPPTVFIVKSIDTSRLSDTMRDQVMARLNIRENSVVDQATYASAREAIREVDEHLSILMRSLGATDPSGTREVSLMIYVQGAMNPADLVGTLRGVIGAAPTSAAQAGERPPIPQRIHVGGNVQAAKLVRQPRPVYPPLARQARIQGTVSFSAVIGKDGRVVDLQLLPGGHPLLVQSAQDAVQQWMYQPTLLNGQPVEVVTEITVNFTLVDPPPDTTPVAVP